MEEDNKLRGVYILGRGWVEVPDNIKVVNLYDVDEYW